MHKNNLAMQVEQSCGTEGGVRDTGIPGLPSPTFASDPLRRATRGSPMAAVPMGRLVWVTHHPSDLSTSKAQLVEEPHPPAQTAIESLLNSRQIPLPQLRTTGCPRQRHPRRARSKSRPPGRRAHCTVHPVRAGQTAAPAPCKTQPANTHLHLTAASS